ncbi:MAG TPA: hypothetical protein VH702_10375 [Vicinamibacterales bacterium]|jgi:hypothetical protein
MNTDTIARYAADPFHENATGNERIHDDDHLAASDHSPAQEWYLREETRPKDQQKIAMLQRVLHGAAGDSDYAQMWQKSCQGE